LAAKSLPQNRSGTNKKRKTWNTPAWRLGTFTREL